MNKKIKRQLKKQFETEIPESLEKDNILNLLPEKEENDTVVIHKNFNVKRTLSLVASLMLVFGVATVYIGSLSQEKDFNQPKISESANDMSEVVKYTTYEPIYEKLEELKSNAYYYDKGLDMLERADDTINGSSASSNETADDLKSNSSKDYGTTNIQEDGVDEGDIIKTDGNFLYVISSADKSKLSVVDCDTLKTVSQIELEKNIDFFELYLIGNKAVCVGKKYKPSSDRTVGNKIYDCIYVYDETDTVVYVYDISNKAEPKEVNVFNQSGVYYSSRMIGTKLYCISTYYADIYGDTITDDCIPSISFNGEERKVPANRISVIEDAKSPSYIVISVFDVESGERPVTEAVLGNTENVYATVDNLYIVDTSYNGSGITSGIFKFDYSDGGINYVCKGTVKGGMLNSFSMSEYNGHLRVAVTETTLVETTSVDGMTASSRTNTTKNSLYILDENMHQVGFVTDLAEGETIKAVRFMGNTAYVVTFRQTDPLFVIDLSDPEKPTVKGKLKITGFSDYLHPVGDNLLVGVGNDGTETGVNGNAKISVFDVSDPTSPTEASKITVLGGKGYAYSPVAGNHKCYVTLNENEFLVPFTVNYGRAYYIRYKIVGKEITEVARYGLCENGSVSGGTYVGNSFYAVIYNFDNDEYEMVSFDLVTHIETGRIALK